VAYLGIDIGTSSVKALVVDEGGDVLARTSVAYPTAYGVGGAAEQDPDHWVRAIADAVRALPAAVRAAVGAIAVDGHVPSLVLVEDAGRPLRAAITWQDARPGAEAERLGAELGDVSDEVGTTLPWAAAQLLPQLAWVAEHEPAARRARWALAPKDYVNLHLTGEVASDPWTAKGMCDTRTGEPVPRLLEAAGWNASIVPTTRTPWEPIGHLRSEIADTLGLPSGVHVATGWTDALAAILAVGAFESPRGFLLTGTSNIVGVSTRRTASATGLYSVPQGPSAPLPLLYGPTQSGGDTLLWWARLLGVDVPELVALAADADGRDLPTIAPYLRGERAPIWDAGLRSLVAGLGVDDDRARVARSVLSGVALGARHVLDLAADAAGDEPDGVDIGGTGADDAGWRAVWLTTLGRRVRIHREPSLSALGAAMLAALATGRTLADLDGLRSDPVALDPEPGDLAAAGAAAARYRRASTIAQDWRTHV